MRGIWFKTVTKYHQHHGTASSTTAPEPRHRQQHHGTRTMAPLQPWHRQTMAAHISSWRSEPDFPPLSDLLSSYDTVSLHSTFSQWNNRDSASKQILGNSLLFVIVRLLFWGTLFSFFKRQGKRETMVQFTGGVSDLTACERYTTGWVRDLKLVLLLLLFYKIP